MQWAEAAKKCCRKFWMIAIEHGCDWQESTGSDHISNPQRTVSEEPSGRKITMSDPKVVVPEESEEPKKKKGPHDPNEINPKLASDIHYWAEEFHVTGQQLHEAIRVHGTHVSKIREALKHHKH